MPQEGSLCEYWRFFSRGNCTTVKVFSVPASKQTKLRENGQSRSLSAFKRHKRPFSAPPQWWSLFWKTLRSSILNTETPIDRTVTLGFTLANTPFHFMWNTFVWRLLAIMLSFLSDPKSLSLSFLFSANYAEIVCQFNSLEVSFSSASITVFLSWFAAVGLPVKGCLPGEPWI